MSDRLSHAGFRLLAPGTRKGNRTWIARGRYAGAQFEYTMAAVTEDAARFEAEMIRAKEREVATARGQSTSEFTVATGARTPRWVKRLLAQARDRASARSVAFSLAASDVMDMAVRAAGRCEMSGLAFRSGGSGRRQPFIPSIDRILPVAGYTPENCRLVCFAVNVAMSDWGEGVFREIAAAVHFRGNVGERSKK